MVIIRWETDTFLLISAESSFYISTQNSIPAIDEMLNSKRVKILEGLNLGLLYLDYFSSNSKYVRVVDNKLDSIFLDLHKWNSSHSDRNIYWQKWLQLWHIY